jgi:hypothetical protein
VNQQESRLDVGSVVAAIYRDGDGMSHEALA